jgi:alanine transaminase
VVNAQYAVRGELAIKSEQYRAQLAKGEGKDLPFDAVISANIGNPQQLDQKPITFFRQVASLLENPLLLKSEQVLITQLGYKKDVIERAKKLLKDVKSVGAYSQSQGAPAIRQDVADFIGRRDGYPADPANIYLCAGASSGVNSLLNVICSSPQTGVLVPIPQYPLYTATLSLLNATCVPYYLNEESNWSTDVNSVREALKDAQKKGIDVRAVVVINPGNPTGGTLVADDIRSVLELAAEEKLVVMADEVYQSNVFEGEFLSFKKGLRDLQRSEKNKDGKFDSLELASLHSISKGMVGECGHRGGYYEMVGFDPEVRSSKSTRFRDVHTNTRIPGRSPNLQIRLHHALRARSRPMHRRLHGQPTPRRRPLLPPLPLRIRQNLHRPALPRPGPTHRLQLNGRRGMPDSTGRDVPLPQDQLACQGDRGGEVKGQEPGRFLLSRVA